MINRNKHNNQSLVTGPAPQFKKEKKTFHIARVFKQVKNTDYFEKGVKTRIKNWINSKISSSILAYGQTNSGWS